MLYAAYIEGISIDVASVCSSDGLYGHYRWFTRRSRLSRPQAMPHPPLVPLCDIQCLDQLIIHRIKKIWK